MSTRKFAFLPVFAETWRNTKCLVWLQGYYVKKKGGRFISLDDDDRKDGYYYVDRLGLFSLEFR